VAVGGGRARKELGRGTARFALGRGTFTGGNDRVYRNGPGHRGVPAGQTLPNTLGWNTGSGARFRVGAYRIDIDG